MADFQKKLGINLIVGAGEAKVLERCLKSVQGLKYDELVVTHATRMEDSEVLEVAGRYATKVAHYVWNDNFSDARNYSFSQSEAQHILWLDSDDVIKESEHPKINSLISELPNIDIALFDYVYSHDEKDRSVLVLPRERLVRNCPQIRWNDSIHEYLNMDGNMRIKRFDIKIDHYRDRPFDPARNLTLLKQEYDKGNASARIAFYYGKELADVGQWDVALPVLEEFVNKGEGFVDNLTVGCIRLSRYYLDKGDKEAARNYAMLGIRFNGIYAENHVTLGNIKELEGDIDDAVRYYKEALTKTLSGGMSQLVDYYGFIPAAKLGTIFLNQKKYDEALKYAEVALQHKPDHPEAHRLKSTIMDEMRRNPVGSTIEQKDIDDLSNFFRNRKLIADVLCNDGTKADLRLRKQKNPKIAWLIPVCDASSPSVRLRRLLINSKLSQWGVPSHIVEGYQTLGIQEVHDAVGEANFVVFTSFGRHELDLMHDMHACGKKVAFDHCEGIFGFPYEDDCMHEADVIFCCSTKLEEMTKQRGFLHTAVLKDSVEEREPKKPHQYIDRGHGRPKACFMGMGGNSFLVTDYLKDTIASAGYDLVVISEWDNATIKWNPDTWQDDLTGCDVALCPQRVDVQPGKSSVKATTAMAFGMPVIASPLQAYKEVITHGENGYIAESKEDWKKALLALKDVNVRRRIGKAAKKSIGPYRLNANVQNYIKLIDGMVNETIKVQHGEKPQSVTTERARDVVDIIIPNYNNLDYLKLCLTSVRINTLHPFHIIVSDAGSGADTWEYLKTLKGITVLGEQGKRKNFSEACNAGIESSRSKFFVIMNSDVIVSKGWLGNMVHHMETVHRLASCGVLSNCDLGWLHSNPRRPELASYPMRLEKAGIDLHPGMKREEIEPHLDELYAFMEASNEKYKDKYTPQEWVAAYCTIYARTAINEVGLFDTQFKNGCEDLDLGRRLGKSGFACGQSIGSFVFHFGGVTRGAYENENRESYAVEDRANHIMLKDKWKKPRIAIWTGPAWEPWNRQKVDEGMAGSETWAAYLARAFVKKGFEVTVYNDLLAPSKNDVVFDPVVEGNTHYGDVRYVDHTKMFEDIRYQYIEYFISSRNSDILKNSLHAGKHYVMIHDVWLSPDQNADVVAWKTQGYAYLSEWHKQFLLGHHRQLPPEKMFLTANGVVQELYAGVRDEDKTNTCVYSSSPDRGLFQLLGMVPEIRKAVPDFTLKVAYGFLNWEEACKRRNDQRGMAFIQRIKEAMKQPGVEYLGRVDKKTLAEHQKKSKVWLQPTWFDETFCCLPDNEITSESGLKKIVDLNLSDRVLTHRNRFRPILKLMSREYSGPVYGFELQNHGRYTGFYTPEHPLHCLPKSIAESFRLGTNAKNRGERYYSDSSLKTFEGRDEWCQAKDIHDGDYVQIPVDSLREPIQYVSTVDSMRALSPIYRCDEDGMVRIKTGSHGIPSKMDLTPDLARFLGFYLAEGSSTSSDVIFSFNKNEVEYQDFVRKFFKDVLGVAPKIKYVGNTAIVFARNHPLGRWLKSIFGECSHHKQVPSFVFSCDRLFILEFLRASFEGDRCDAGNEYKISLASKSAIHGLKQLCHKVGLHPNYQEACRDGKRAYILGVSRSLWSELMEGKPVSGKRYRVFLEYGGDIYYRVKKVATKQYCGKVYNMDVEEDHSYTSNSVAVHNCISAVEAGLSHNAILSTDKGGLKTTIGSAGILLPPTGLSMGESYPKSYTDRFIEEAIKLLTDEGYRRSWADKARDKVSVYTWDKIADDWIKKFTSSHTSSK